MKKILKIVVVIVAVFSIFSCFILTEKSAVKQVKTGAFTAYPDVTLENFFKYFLDEPLWDARQDEGTFAFFVAVSGKIKVGELKGTEIVFIFRTTTVGFETVGAVAGGGYEFDEDTAWEILDEYLYIYTHR